jgi:hypothetical protein
MYGRRQNSESVVEEKYDQKGDYRDGGELDRCPNLVSGQQLELGTKVLEEGKPTILRVMLTAGL